MPFPRKRRRTHRSRSGWPTGTLPAYAGRVTARDEDRDFTNDMYVAVVEECPLWELPLGTTDLLAGGVVRHGPWESRACAELIIRWLDKGWVELYLPDVPPQWELKPAEQLRPSATTRPASGGACAR